jgi:hypothetical protein
LRRFGIADESSVVGYAGAYSGAVSWLALRTSEACPLALPHYDAPCASAAIAVFAFGALEPLRTLFTPAHPPLSPTERMRVTGTAAVGLLGAVFIPDCLAFAIGGEEWWSRVALQHPAQRTLESSTSLFALFATEASMVAHRAGKLGKDEQ